MKQDIRTQTELLADYKEYCDDKIAIDEEPLLYPDWLYLETIAYQDYSE